MFRATSLYSASEYSLYSLETFKNYFYDFACFSTIPNFIIEFNGDFWHMNPDKYSFEDSILLNGKSVNATCIWNKDAEKREIAENAGFFFVTVWESNYRKDPASEIKKVIDYVKENCKFPD